MIHLHRCAACGTASHPPRILCPVCGGPDWQDAPCDTAIVEQCTSVAGPVVLATVRCAAGPALVVALPALAEPGTRVRLRPGPARSILGDPA